MKRKKLGQARLRIGATSIQVPMRPSELAKLDRWIAHQRDEPSRPKAIRRLVEWALATTPPAAAHKGAAYAEKVASEQIDQVLKGSGHPAHVKAERKRRLTKFPAELGRRK
jgi:hypothetical protein